MLHIKLDRFSPGRYIEKAKRLDFLELLQDIETEITTLERMHKTDAEEHKKIYMNFLNDFRIVCEQGTYTGKNEDQRLGIKSVLSSLVEKGQLTKSLLKNL